MSMTTAEDPGILLIDDETDALDEMRVCLENYGFNCQTAASATEARSVWRTVSPIGVVVADIRMPDGDGLELLADMAKDGTVLPPEAVVVTGHGSVDSAVVALRLHVADFLCKPIGRDELVAAVQAALERYQARRRIAEDRNRDAAMARLLRSTGEHLNDLARGMLANLARDLTQPTTTTSGPPPKVSPAVLRRLIDERATRAELFREDKLAEAGWDMLLELLLAQVEGRPVYMRNLSMASLLPTSTALRRIADLERLNLVKRSPDPLDRRRVVVELSSEGARRMMTYVHQINLAGSH